MVEEEQDKGVGVAPVRRLGSVEIRGGLVYKRGTRRALELEAVRTRLAQALGERSGRFTVPQVQWLDVPGQLLATEYLPQLVNLHEVAAGAVAEPEAVFQAAGRALATVHRDLRLPAEYVLPLPESLRWAAEEEVPLHGDFCCTNVCWVPGAARLVLLDWASAPLFGGLATYGSRYFDLVWFAWSLFFWMPPQRLLRWRPERLMRALGQGYAEVENRFRWERYLQYRWVVRGLPAQYWKGKRAVVRSGPAELCAQLLGWLRWRRFPRWQANRLNRPTPPKREEVA